MFRAAAVALAALTPFAASAQSSCMPRDRLVEVMEERFGSKPLGSGVTENTVTGTVTVVEFFASTGGHWAIVHSFTTGYSCVMAQGAGYKGIAFSSGPSAPGVDG